MLPFNSRHLFSERIDEEEGTVQKRRPAKNRQDRNTSHLASTAILVRGEERWVEAAKHLRIHINA
jgi:hypothetical protein